MEHLHVISMPHVKLHDDGTRQSSLQAGRVLSLARLLGLTNSRYPNGAEVQQHHAHCL
jgi:hypothetical protein